MKKINILFVCRYNRFRSRIAEAYFNKINKNKNIEAKSAGLIKGYNVDRITAQFLKKELGIDISGKTNGLNSKNVSWQNLTVIVADNVPKSVFDRNKEFGKKVMKYSIKDTSNRNKKMELKIAKRIMEKIDVLVKTLEKKI